MELVEVVLQGVRGVPNLTRWTFPAGVAVVPAGAGEQLALRAAYELLSGEQEGVLATAALPEAGAQARAAIILVGRDQRRYRLVWELQSGRRALQVMNGDKMEVVSTSQAEIVQTLTAQVGFPQSDVLKEIFFSFMEDQPSRRVIAAGTQTSGASSKADKPLPPGFDDAPAAEHDSDKPLPPGFDGGATTSRFVGRPAAELQARLSEIKARTEGQVDVQALEFELDGLQKKVFELQARRRPLSEAEAGLATLDQQLARYAYLDSLPDDFLERATRLESIRVEHDRDIERLDLEAGVVMESVQHLSEEVSGVRQRGGPRPMQAAANDPLVRWGVVGGVAAIVLAAVGGLASESMRYLAFLNIPAFGVAVFGGIKLLGGLEEGASTRMKLERIAGERKRIVERFAIDKEQVERLLQKHEMALAQLPELTDNYTVRDDLRQRRQALVEQQSSFAGDVVGLDAEVAANAERIRVLEEQLSAAGSGYDPDLADLAREADEIERVLRGEIAAPVAAAAPPPVEEKPAVAAAPARESGVDVAQLLIRLASDLVMQSIDDTAIALAPRAGQMMHALTDGRFTSMTSNGKQVMVANNAGSAIAYVDVEGPDRDLIAMALKLAIVESVTKLSGRLPVVFDRTFDVFPVEKAPLFVRALQFLGSSTQVICLTQRRELAGAGTVVQGQVASGANPAAPA